MSIRHETTGNRRPEQEHGDSHSTEHSKASSAESIRNHHSPSHPKFNSDHQAFTQQQYKNAQETVGKHFGTPLLHESGKNSHGLDKYNGQSLKDLELPENNDKKHQPPVPEQGDKQCPGSNIDPGFNIRPLPGERVNPDPGFNIKPLPGENINPDPGFNIKPECPPPPSKEPGTLLPGLPRGGLKGPLEPNRKQPLKEWTDRDRLILDNAN